MSDKCFSSSSFFILCTPLLLAFPPTFSFPVEVESTVVKEEGAGGFSPTIAVILSDVFLLTAPFSLGGTLELPLKSMP